MKLLITQHGSLKNHLESLGYLFPCEGKGLCGRCKITAPNLNPTNLDRRFLGEHEINAGTRLACDKIVIEPIEIECELKQKTKELNIEHPCAYALFGDNETEIGLTDDDIILKNVILPSPPCSKQELRGFFNLHALEMFETYKVAKAETIILLGTPTRIKAIAEVEIPLHFGEMYYAKDLNLPGEDIYIPPIPTLETGSDDFIELLDLPEKSLLISGSLFLYKGEDILCVTSDKDGDSKYGKKAFLSTLEYFIKKLSPPVIYTFNSFKEVENVGGKTIERRARYLATELLISKKKKAELNKLAKRVVTMSLADDDLWQNIFSNI